MALSAFCVLKWGNLSLTGETPVPLLTFIAILFTSALDIGVIMFPLVFDFPLFADTTLAPAYGFTNPLALEFGFWGFLIWAFYFLPIFYFCAIEPRVKFFEIPAVKLLNNAVILTACGFTGALFVIYLPYYLPEIGDGESIWVKFYLISFVVFLCAAYSATQIRFVRYLSVSSMFLFLALIVWMALNAGMRGDDLVTTGGDIGGYFSNLHRFVTPLTASHEFYLFWWFVWSILIGQFVSRFIGGLKVWQLLVMLLVVPSIPLGLWFTVLYHYHVNAIATAGLSNWVMVFVGIVFVVNSLDSLIRLYTDNLGLTAQRLGSGRFVLGNAIALFALTLMLRSQWLQIQWVGTVVIGMYLAALGYVVFFKRSSLAGLTSNAQMPHL